MNALGTLADELRKSGIDVEIDPPLDPDGRWFLDAVDATGHRAATVVWDPKKPGELNLSYDSPEHPRVAFDETPDAVVSDPDKAVLRVLAWILEGKDLDAEIKKANETGPRLEPFGFEGPVLLPKGD